MDQEATAEVQAVLHWMHWRPLWKHWKLHKSRWAVEEEMQPKMPLKQLWTPSNPPWIQWAMDHPEVDLEVDHQVEEEEEAAVVAAAQVDPEEEAEAVAEEEAVALEEAEAAVEVVEVVEVAAAMGHHHMDRLEDSSR